MRPLLSVISAKTALTVAGDVLFDDLSDGAVSLQLSQSLVDLVEQLSVALVDADGVVFHSVLVLAFQNVTLKRAPVSAPFIQSRCFTSVDSTGD